MLRAVDISYGHPDVFSYWAFSDVFEEHGFPTANSSFFGGFGLLNLYQVPKPTYRALQLLHETGSTRIPAKQSTASSQSSSSSSSLCAINTGVIASVNSSSTSEQQQLLLLLLYNHAPWQNTSSCDCLLSASISGLPATALAGATVRRIDQQHANPRQTWIDLGMPQYPTAKQIAQMQAGSALLAEPLATVAQVTSSSSFTFTLPQHSVFAVSVPLQVGE